MTDEELFGILKKLVGQGNDSLNDARIALLDYRNAGGHQDKAKMIAERFRIEFIDNEYCEDRVLEILYIIVGWCRNDLKIWN